jgi:hypothetical protein
MKPITNFKASDGEVFDSEEKCLEYENYKNVFKKKLCPLLPKEDGVLDSFSYVFNPDLTITEWRTHRDDMSCRAPFSTPRNLGHIKDLLRKYKI